MLRFSDGLKTMILFCSIILLGFINTSNADIEIDLVQVFPSLDSYDRFSMLVYVETNEPYYEVNYYLDETWIGYGYGGNNNRTDDIFWYYVSNFGGSLHGTEHHLKIDVCGEDIDGNFTYDTVTKTVKVYKPIVESGYGEDTGVYGETELSRHSYEHPCITFEGYVWARNWTESDLDSSSSFRHTVNSVNFFEQKESEPPKQTISKDGGTYGPYYENYTESMQVNISRGGRGEYSSHVYIRQSVEGNVADGFKKDHWDILTNHTFVWD